MTRKASGSKTSVLVIGGGIAGSTAAVRLAQAGATVHLVERNEEIGGRAAEMGCKATDVCLHCNVCAADDIFRSARVEPNIRLHTRAELRGIRPGENGKRFKASVLQRRPDGSKPRSLTVRADAVIVAAGYEPYDPCENSAYGYGRVPNVITGIEAERQLADQNRLVRPSDGKTPQRVAFIQCVGSRTEEMHRNPEDTDYCSAVCCSYALRIAQRLKHQSAESDTTIFYMDIQNFGKGFNAFYRECRSRMRFIRSRPYELQAVEGDNVAVKYTPPEGPDVPGARVCEEAFDLVVLSVGIRPPASAGCLSDKLGLPLDACGFFGIKGASALPDLHSEGIFAIGACEAPKDIAGSMAQAEAVAAEVVRTAASRFRGSIYRAAGKDRDGQTVELTTKTVNNGVLVVGGGVAGMQAAVGLAELGHDVTLIHSRSALGGAAAAAPELFQHVNGAAGGPGGGVAASVSGLAEAANANERIAILPRTTLKSVQGELGGFSVTVEKRGARKQLDVGAVVLACGAGTTPVSDERRAVTDMRGLVRRLRSGRIPRRVALVMDRAGEQPVAVSSQVLSVAEQMASDHGTEVAIFCRNVRVAATGMESLYRRARAAGVTVTRCDGRPGIAQVGREISVSVQDPVAGVELSAAFDLAVIADLKWAGNGDRFGSEVPNLKRGPEGVLQADDVWLLPGLTSRPGIFSAGGARGSSDYREALTDGLAVAGEVHSLLGKGRIRVGDDAAIVDAEKCVLCLTCVRICPHGAIAIDDGLGAAAPSAVTCRRCGVCASECPAQAITLPGFSDAATEKEIGQNPGLVVFACENSAVLAAEALAGKDDRTALKIIPVPCAGEVDPRMVLKALEKGAERVLVVGCHPESCRYIQGSSRASKRVARLKDMLTKAGADASRVEFRGISAVEPRRFSEYLKT